MTVADVRAMLAVCSERDLRTLLAELEADARAERDRLESLMTLQRELHCRGLKLVAGVDEVGRGALAGPVTAAAVVLHPDTLIAGLDDSKRVPRERRPALALAIRADALAVCVADATPREIDALGIGAATRLAWRRAIEGLGVAVDHVLIDGNDAAVDHPATAVVGGDRKCACIAAASVVAKVHRDRMMAEELAPLYPAYGLEGNYGYGTPEHMAAIVEFGPSPVHRRSFAPCSEQGSLF